MRKLIHSDFELDLSNFKISDTEENNWFSDVFFTKYSFPFEIDLDSHFDVATGFISHYNASNTETYFECKYVHNDEIHDAILEIESHENRLSCVLRYGFEQLPSFDKKLSELSLETIDLDIVSVYDYANTIITKTWPEVNFNYPQVAIDSIDNTQDNEWAFFEGIINNRQNGQFLQNIYNQTEEYSENYNIMQPLPYWLHILERGFADAGYIFAGKIKNDEILKKALLFHDAKYFKLLTLKSYYCYIEYNNFISIQEETNEGTFIFNPCYPESCVFTETDPTINSGFYQYETILENHGRYNFSGRFYLLRHFAFLAYFQIIYKGITIYEVWENPLNDGEGSNTPSSNYIYYDINFNLDTTISNQNNNISIILKIYRPDGHPIYNNDFALVDIAIDQIYNFDEFQNLLPSVINENKVELKKTVPDLTFGDFIKIIKNWFNYDLTVIDKYAIMNPIEDEINFDNALSLERYEVKYPRRTFKKGYSYLLKFQDIDSKDYTYKAVFQDKTQILYENYTIDNEKTSTIEINALPLPIKANAAHAFEQNDSKAYLVCYDGTYLGNNYPKPNTPYLLPEVHPKYWKKWLQMRINTHAFQWTFLAHNIDILELKAKRKVFAYNNFHIIKMLNKTEIKPDIFEIQIETESIK